MLKEYIKLAYCMIAAMVVFALMFFKSPIEGVRTAAIIFALFILPGFALLHKQRFTERLVFGFIISLALIGIPSYYLGVLGFNIRYHFVFAIIISAVGIGIELMKKEDENGDAGKPQEDIKAAEERAVHN